MPIFSRALPKFPGPVVLALLLVGSLCASAQTTQQAIEARLKGRPLYLRGLWEQNKLQFDSSGDSSSPADSAPFTISGVDVRKVSLKTDHLEIDGDRVGIEFLNDGPKRVSLKTHIQIAIAASPSADYGAALDKIFANNLSDLVPSMPAYWQRFAQTGLTAKLDDVSAYLAKARRSDASHLGPRAPHLLQTSEPHFTPEARKARYSAVVVISFTAKEDGSVSNPYIVRPAGLGLDEQAIAAVLNYRFKPATRDDGTPIPVELDVEINFQIF